MTAEFTFYRIYFANEFGATDFFLALKHFFGFKYSIGRFKKKIFK